MKKYIIVIIFSTILVSCSKQPICDETKSIKMAKELILQEMKQLVDVAEYETLEKFVNENIEIINIRTNSKDEDLKKCDCSSEITFKYSDDFIKKLKEKESFFNSSIGAILNKQISFDYDLQIINNNKELFLQSVLPTIELNDVFSMFSIASNEFNKKNEDFFSDEDFSNDETIDDEKDSISVSIEKYGIIKVNQSKIYSTPDISSESDLSFFKGDSVYVVKLERGMYLLNYKGGEGGKAGYVLKEDLDLN